MNNVRLVAVGDIFLKTKDDAYPFRYANLAGDIILGNLEVVLSEKGEPAEKRVPVRAKPEKARYLSRAGFNILSLANNHVLDYGLEGYHDTLKSVRGAGIKYIGVVEGGRNVSQIVTKDDITVGFLAYSDYGDSEYVSRIDIANILNEVDELRAKVDVVIISLHWGIEYVSYPMPIQQEIARRMIDGGASVVLGHHPHVIQGIEQYGDGIICYSLGNFQFRVEQDNNFKGADKGIIANIDISQRGIEIYEITPITINDNWQPVEMPREEKERFLEFVGSISIPLQGENISEQSWFEHASGIYLKSQFQSWAIRIREYGMKHLYLFLRTAISPFYVRMYWGFIRRWLKASIGHNARLRAERVAVE